MKTNNYVAIPFYHLLLDWCKLLAGSNLEVVFVSDVVLSPFENFHLNSLLFLDRGSTRHRRCILIIVSLMTKR